LLAPASGTGPYVIWIGERDGSIIQELLRGIGGIQQVPAVRDRVARG
jgi:hypothetical protein